MSSEPKELRATFIRLRDHFPPGYGLASAAGKLPRVLTGLHFDTIVEIGTLRAHSTIALAYFADTVITVDIEEQPETREAIAISGVGDRIIPVVVTSDAAKERLLAALNFDLAFIDGDHTYDGVALDFRATHKCGSVLFHDYWHTKWTGIRKFVDELPADELTITDTFGWWRAK